MNRRNFLKLIAIAAGAPLTKALAPLAHFAPKVDVAKYGVLTFELLEDAMRRMHAAAGTPPLLTFAAPRHLVDAYNALVAADDTRFVFDYANHTVRKRT